MNWNDFKNVQKANRIYDQIPSQEIPIWGLSAIKLFEYHINYPKPVDSLIKTASNPDNYHKSYECFQEIRQFGLENDEFEPNDFLYLSELIAKIIYNQTEESKKAPFDFDTGYKIIPTLHRLGDFFADNELKRDISLFLKYNIFRQIKNDFKFSSNYTKGKRIHADLIYQTDNNLYGKFNNVASKERLVQKFYKFGWSIRKSSSIDFEIQSDYCEINIEGDDKNPIFNGVLIAKRYFDDFADFLLDLGLNYSMELVQDDKIIKTAYNSGE